MEDEENAITEDVDVGENFVQDEDVKPDMGLMKKKKPIGPRNECPYGCSKLLAPRTIDYHRTNGCRIGTEEPVGDTSKRRNHCCGVCFSEFVTRTAFFNHLREEHDVRAEVHKMTFGNRDIFDRFVKWLEMEGGAHFRLKSGSKRRKNGRGIFLSCNRSGFVGPCEVDPLKNRTGPYRTGYSCTAYINGCEYNDGTISVDVCGDHYGHDARMRLPNVIKYVVAQKQLDGESALDVLSFLKRHFSPLSDENIYAQRICLVDQDELRTLMASYTKKWENAGIPHTCEIWEEELLDRAGIRLNDFPRLREPSEPTTQELADSMDWPRPVVFIAKMRTDDGFVELPELYKSTAEARRMAASATQQNEVYHEYPDDLPAENMESENRHYSAPSDMIVQNPYEDGEQIGMEYNINQVGGSNVQYPHTGSPVVPHTQRRGRKGILNLISSEVETISRQLDCELSHVSNKSLVSVLTRLKSARSLLHSALEASANYREHRMPTVNRNNNAYCEDHGVNGEIMEDILERQDQVEYVTEIDSKAILSNDGNVQSIELNDVSDDESIVNHVGCVNFKSSLWN